MAIYFIQDFMQEKFQRNLLILRSDSQENVQRKDNWLGILLVSRGLFIIKQKKGVIFKKL